MPEQAVIPPLLSVRVVCDEGHLLSGLFIAFKLRRRAESEAHEKLARVLEAFADPGEEPVAPTGKAARDKKARERYDRDHAAWQRRVKASQDLPPDPGERFVLGFVDDDGYLVPVHEGSNPWWDAAAKHDPDLYKLGLGETYDACWIRHPNPALARAVVRHLNGEAIEGDARFGIARWGELTRAVTVETQRVATGEQYVFRLPESPSAYVPPGPARYGGWTLYLDMPHAQCADVPDHVETCQRDLARLRYPIGRDRPYQADPCGMEGTERRPADLPVSTKLDDRVAWEQAVRANPKNPPGMPRVERPIHSFHGQVQAAVGAFHEHVMERRAFRLSLHDQIEKSDWAYLFGDPLAFVAGAEGEHGWAVPENLYKGTVCASTADCLEHWIERGLRQPGSVMIRAAKTGQWMQERAALAVDVWAMLIEACGVRYGLKAGSTYRRLMVPVWAGSVKASTHKTGLAVDLSGGGKRGTLEKFPIRYEAEWVPIRDRKGNPVSTPDDKAHGKLNYRLLWRLYAHSELDVDSARDRGRLVESWSALAAGGIRRALRKGRLAGLEGPAVDAWLDARVGPHEERIRAMVAEGAEALIAKFFRREVRQFVPNAYESDGGTSLPPQGPKEGTRDYPAEPWAESWVNLTALAYPSGMERIGAHNNSVKDHLWIMGEDKSKPVVVSMRQFFKKKGEESDLVTLLEDLAASRDEASEMMHRSREIAVVTGSGKKAVTVRTFTPEQLDSGFMRTWRDRVLALPSELRIEPRRAGWSHASRPEGAQIRVVLSVTTDGASLIDRVAAELEGRFADRRFVVTHAGEMVRHVLAASTMPGRTLGAGLRMAQRVFAEESALGKAMHSIAEAGKPAEAPVESAPAKKPSKKQLAEAERRTREAWTVVIQPVFFKDPGPEERGLLPEHSLVLPRGRTANHLEWWHFQHRDCGSCWGDTVREVGWSHEVMITPRTGSPDPSPGVHRGGDYEPKDLAARTGSFNQGMPGNTMSTPPSGG